jgi:hypothetical protein
MLSCIGCGRIDTAQQCAGTCGEHRLDIVGAAAHDHMLDALAAERRRLRGLRAFVERVVRCEPGEYAAVRADARSLLSAPQRAGDAPAPRLTTWACGGCGRVEAEAPCVGICTDAPIDVVRASVYDEARAELATVRARVGELVAVARLVAFTQPRDGDSEAHLHALKRVADERVAAAQPRSTDRTADASTAHAVRSSSLERA